MRRQRSPEADVVAFWSRVDVAQLGPGGCWPWLASTDSSGYGQVRFGGRKRKAHQVALELVNRALPRGLEARHLCHRPICVNPAHLVHGTHAQNVADMVAAGRVSRGTSKPNAKLTDLLVLEIRRLRAGGRAVSAIARAMGLSIATVSEVARGLSWKHVKPPVAGEIVRSA